MSSESELLRRFYPGNFDLVAALADEQAFKRAFAPLVHPDVETVAAPGQLPVGSATPTADEEGRFAARGIDGFLSAFRDWLSAWDSWVIGSAKSVELDEERVLALFEIAARSKTHGVEMPVEGANILTVREGKVARIELFLDQTSARRAAGLE